MSHELSRITILAYIRSELFFILITYGFEFYHDYCNCNSYTLITFRRIAPIYPPRQFGPERTMSQRGGTTNSKLLLNIIIVQCGKLLSVYMLCVPVCGILVQDERCILPKMKTKNVNVELQIRLHRLCEDRASGRKSISEFLWSVSHNLRGGQPNI